MNMPQCYVLQLSRESGCLHPFYPTDNRAFGSIVIAHFSTCSVQMPHSNQRFTLCYCQCSLGNLVVKKRNPFGVIGSLLFVFRIVAQTQKGNSKAVSSNGITFVKRNDKRIVMYLLLVVAPYVSDEVNTRIF